MSAEVAKRLSEETIVAARLSPARDIWKAIAALVGVTFEEAANMWAPHVPRQPDPVAWALEESGFTHSADAWESLAVAGVIPMEWVDHPGRRFIGRGVLRCPSCKGDGKDWSQNGSLDDEDLSPDCGTCDGTGELESDAVLRKEPGTLREVVAFAADPRGVVTAETIALELAEACKKGAERVVWVAKRPMAILNEMKTKSREWDTIPVDAVSVADDLLGAQAAAIRFERSPYGLLMKSETKALLPRIEALLATGYAMDSFGTRSPKLICPSLPESR